MCEGECVASSEVKRERGPLGCDGMLGTLSGTLRACTDASMRTQLVFALIAQHVWSFL